MTLLTELRDRVQAATTEYTLRAMAANYRNGNSWDHLDKKACIKAADEIRALRALLTALAEQEARV